MTGLPSYCAFAALVCASVAVSAGGAVNATEELPAPVAMSRGAGNGMLLSVEVHTENGEAFPCTVDTGSPNTVLPAFLEPTLGKRLGSRRFSTLDSPDKVEHLYAAPKLYLGRTRLATGTQVGTSGSFGVLGMDCLGHYCIQLDFEARVLRFLSSGQVKVADLGRPFSLTKSRYATIKHAAFFQSKDTELLLDTGCPFDGYLNPRAFKRAVREQHAQSLPLLKDRVVQGTAPGVALFSQCVWDNESYTNLIIGKRLDLIGLKFLGRHLVTFDFPGGRVYLKRTGADGRLPKTVSMIQDQRTKPAEGTSVGPLPQRQVPPQRRLPSAARPAARRGCLSARKRCALRLAGDPGDHQSTRPITCCVVEFNG